MFTYETKVCLWRRWHGENAYMWDPGKFYDDLEHSIFEKKCLHVGSNKILLQPGTLYF
jgi:hypothetical protein